MRYEFLKHFKATLLVSAILAFSSPLVASKIENSEPDGKAPQTSPQKQERSLFLQTANTATIEKSKEDKGKYTITLDNASPTVICFSDRPFRNASILAIEKLLELWERKGEEGFKANPPNAAINVHQVNNNKESQTYTVILTNPIYDLDKKTLRYTIESLNGSPTVLPDAATLHHITIFIDDICLKCWRP